MIKKRKRRHKFVTCAEVKAMRKMAMDGGTVSDIVKAFNRPETTVRNYCRDLARKVDKGPERLLRILQTVEKSRAPRAVIACDLGYASVNSLDVILVRARRVRAAMEARP